MGIKWDIITIPKGTTKCGKQLFAKEVQNLIAVDTESSTGYFDAAGSCYPYNHSRAAEGFYDDKDPSSLLYLWQSAIDLDDAIPVYMGRHYETYGEYLQSIARSVFCQVNRLNRSLSSDAIDRQMEDDNKAVATVHLYIHNLGYEMQFFRNLFDTEFTTRQRKARAVFARNPRKPLTIRITKWRIRWVFHDTLVLTQKTLKNWGKDEELEVQKLDEPADFYLPIRTPETPLTEEEIKYGENDVVTMIHGLRKYKEKYKTLDQIPMTQTGAVRRACLAAASQDLEWMEKTKAAVAAYGYKKYRDLCRAYLGGYVHTNYRYTGKHFKAVNGELVICYDFRSSYPAWMVLKRFPVGPLHFATEEEWNEEQKKDINKRDRMGFATYRFTKVKAKTCNTFWSFSKCIESEYPVLDNGKIYKADMIKITITDLDYAIFCQAYEFETAEYIDGYLAEAARLPLCLIKLILTYYEHKTSLKGDDSKKSLYTESKQFINSIYGCAVTRLISDIIEFVGGEDPWQRQELTEDQFYEEIEKLQKKAQFLSYQIGVWVAAWARYSLWEAVLALDKKVIYCDTDSVKGLFGPEEIAWFDAYNAGVQKQIDEAASDLGLSPEDFAPKTPKEKKKEIGYFDREDDCVEFRAWGAKRYAYRVSESGRENDKDTGIRLTVAGLPKKGVRLLRDDIANFRPGLHWSGSQSGKTTALYLDDQKPRRWRDRDGRYYETTDKYGIAMTPAPFLFDTAEEYRQFLHMVLTPHYFDEDPCAAILR